MATVITTTDWDATGVYKDGSWSSLTTSKQKTKVFNIAFGACDSYATGGMVVDFSDGGRISTVVLAQPSQLSCPNITATYTADCCDEAATGKIQFFEAVCTGCTVGLTEIACCSCLINDVTLKVFIIGK